MTERELISEALQALGKRNLVLGIHDVSFPGFDADDPGRGSPYSAAAQRFYEWATGLGFTGIQWGPQGLVSEGSDSPYEGTLFARNVLNLDLASLTQQGLLPPKLRDEVVASRSNEGLQRVSHRRVWHAMQPVLDALASGRSRWSPELTARFEAFRARHAEWLLRDALYEALCLEHGQGYYLHWPGAQGAQDRLLWSRARQGTSAQRARIAELMARHRPLLERFAVAQFWVAEQHAVQRQRLAELKLSTFGDLQIGLSARDEWAYQALLLEGYRMGAPPSRTNLEGQPWGYAVLDPELPEAVAFVRARVEKLMAEVDGIRIDHPHGWVCPWVYRSDDPSALHAVQTGARLNCSPLLEDHPALARYAIPHSDQIAFELPRYADGWVQSLSDEQVGRFGALMETMLLAVQARGLSPQDVACEVLSTLPYPLGRVMARHGLGRFRVLPKANLHDPTDVYRSENAMSPDWVMLGNHDTRPIWCVVDEWAQSSRLREYADYLASHLEPNASDRAAFSQLLCERPERLAEAMLADALACPASNLFLFFADLLGMREVYNAPGTVGPQNWSLRVSPDWEERYERQRRAGLAFHLPRALAMALRARGDRSGLSEKLKAL
jgi:4-alpha-glucanotransferase